MPIYSTSTFKEFTDINTGEITTHENSKTWTVKANSENFYYFYIEYLMPLFNVTRNIDKKVLNYLLCNMVYNTNEVALDRKLAIKELGTHASELTRAIKVLTEKGVIALKEGSKMTYVINPKIAWKGDATTRKKLLKGLELTFRLVLED